MQNYEAINWPKPIWEENFTAEAFLIEKCKTVLVLAIEWVLDDLGCWKALKWGHKSKSVVTSQRQKYKTSPKYADGWIRQIHKYILCGYDSYFIILFTEVSNKPDSSCIPIEHSQDVTNIKTNRLPTVHSRSYILTYQLKSKYKYLPPYNV